MDQQFAINVSDLVFLNDVVLPKASVTGPVEATALATLQLKVTRTLEFVAEQQKRQTMPDLTEAEQDKAIDDELEAELDRIEAEIDEQKAEELVAPVAQE